MSRMALQERFSWAGGTIRWDRAGSGSPVVLCHGTPWSSFTWRSTVEALSSDHEVYTWDMLGYGQSDKPAGDVSLAEQARLLTALVRHWNIERPALVCHDYGGAVGLRAHLLHGLQVRSLALVDVVALSPWGTPFFRLVADHAYVFASLPSNLHEALVREYIAGASHPGLDDDIQDALAAPWLGKQGQEAFYRQIAQADEAYTDEIEPLYPQIDAPTMIVWGTDDQWIPVDRAYRLHDLIPHSRLELIEGAGHLVQEDTPEELTALLADWLADNTGDNPAPNSAKEIKP